MKSCFAGRKGNFEMKRDKILAVLLVLVAAVLLLASCNADKTPDGEMVDMSQLKINGIEIENYSIVVPDTYWGGKYAAEYLQKSILSLTGHELSIVDKADGAQFYMESDSADDGFCHVDVDGEKIILSGVGLNGAQTAAKRLISELGRTADVTLESFDAPMFTLPNTAAALKYGTLYIGTMGDSVPHAPGLESLAVQIPLAIGEAYPDAQVFYKNPSLGGRNTFWGVYNIDELLLNEGYHDLVFITLGLNDPPYGADYDEIVLNTQSMIEKIMRANPFAEIVMLNYGRKGHHELLEKGDIEYCAKARLDVAEYYGIPFLDICYDVHQRCLESGSYDTEWASIFQDEVHPNQIGQDYYANFYLQTLLPAIEAAGDAELEARELPERIFANSKINGKPYDARLNEYPASREALNIRNGEGEEAGWQENGWTYTEGSSIYFDFEGIGFELYTNYESEMAKRASFLVEVFNEEGERVLERKIEKQPSYYTFVTNELAAEKYTAKVTVTDLPEGMGFRIAHYCIIEDPNK
jgi:hypothetical protein